MPKRKQLLLNRNEVAQGPSPRVIAALRNFPPSHANFYFPGYYTSILAAELSKKFGIPRDRTIIGMGAEDILQRMFDSLDSSRHAVILHEAHFDFYDFYLTHRGVHFEEFRLIEGEKEFMFDVEDCLAKIRTLTPRLVLITSPNNPTGNSLALRDLRRILRAAPKDCIVAIDEAYYGFDAEYKEKDMLALLRRHRNLMLIRTFSKLYALAGLRIGYALCGKDVRGMLRYQEPRLGGSRVLEEVAVAALRSPAYYRALSKEIARERDAAIRKINRLPHFKAFASRANIIAVKVHPRAKALLQQEMDRLPVLIAKFYALNLIRISVAPHTLMEQFLAAMSRADRNAAAASASSATPAASKKTRVRKTPRSAGRKA